ncbi:MAG: hypothetical protein JXB38_00805 [Anaerolineales bacterium]|nr:hypothetical protein [Anaerolineales bacterium]
MKRIFQLALFVLLFVGGCAAVQLNTTAAPVPIFSQQVLSDDPSPPTSPLRLIFVHHSTGGNWLADIGEHEDAGGLGRTLMDNNYYVSATNYGWTVSGDDIGSRTDIGHWWEWFNGPTRDAIMAALYVEDGQNIGGYGWWPRLDPAPAGENRVIVFKSCYPNAHLGGTPNDPPTSGNNPLRGQDAWSEHMTVGNAKGIYVDLLGYFEDHQDKLFIVVTAPPLLEDDGAQPTDPLHAANARAFNNWLVNDWLDGYPHNNVAVFDFYNVLTSNGGDPYTNDAEEETGNHHRWWNGAIQHIQTVSNNFSAYATDGDSHPTGAGGVKASAEFVLWLNVIVNRWLGTESTATPTATTTSSIATRTPTTTSTPTRTPTTAGTRTPTPTSTPPGAVLHCIHLTTLLKARPAAPSVRPLPDTWEDIHVFNDQLWLYDNPAWVEFSAMHYDGTQKMTRADADALRAVNPAFILLNYRLGMGLGYQSTDGWDTCNFNGEWLAVIEGNDWVQEWPGDGVVAESWFYHWPEISGSRTVNCDWGWYLMDPNSPGWRTYWSGEVLRQLEANNADGLFADSFSVPNYLGYDHFDPDLPGVDASFEADWTTRLENFIAFAQSGALAPYYFVPNAGMLVTSRETTNYSMADGVMIEGFSEWGWGWFFDLSDWQLQMNNILELVNLDRVVIAQQYVNANDVNDRMFILANYLLIKGQHTYINLDHSMEPEWFPEYEISIGHPTGSTPATVDDLWNAAWGVYARTYSNGLVLVNPTASTQTIDLNGIYYQATPSGGGIIPDDGVLPTDWKINYAAINQITLGANEAAILLLQK